MKRKVMSLGLTIVLVMPFACGKKDAKVGNAVVTFSVGEALFFKDNAWRKLEVGSLLLERDRVKTGEASTVDIQIGQSVVRVKENSEVLLSTIYRDSATGMESSTLDLSVGVVLAKPKKLMKGESFLVKTPTAVAGVRGTMFTVETTEARDTRVAVLDGKVEVGKRIMALEEAEQLSGKDAEIIQQLEQHVEESAVTVTENKAVEVKSKAVDEVNRKVETIVEKLADSGEKKVEVPQEEMARAIAAVAAAPALKTEEIKVEKALVEEFESMKVVEVPKEEAVKEDKVERSDLELTVTPENALVYLNGEVVGAGNVKLSLLPGTYSIRIQAEGYEDMQREYTVLQGKNEEEAITLQRIKLLDRVRWNLGVKEAVRGILYSGRNVFIATDNGTVLALNRANGMKVWENRLGSPVTSGMVMDNDAIFLSTADEKLHAVEKEKGSTVWSQELGGAVINNLSPVVTPEAVFIATSRGAVYSFSKRGKRNWKTSLSAGVFETPLLVNGTVLLSTADGKLYALKSSRGSEQWVRDVGSKFKIAFLNDTIYTVGYYGLVRALKADTGDVLWTRDLKEPMVINPLMLRDRIVLASTKGRVVALSPRDGTILFRRNLGGAVKTNMTLVDNELYVSSGDTLYAMDVNGGVQWSYDAPSRIATSASVAGNEVYVGLDNGRVISLNRSLAREPRQ